MERFNVRQVEDEDIRSRIPKSIKTVVGPLIVGIDGEVWDDGDVSDFDFVKVFIDDHRGVEGVLSVSRHVVLGEVAPHELLWTKELFECLINRMKFYGA